MLIFDGINNEIILTLDYQKSNINTHFRVFRRKEIQNTMFPFI